MVSSLMVALSGTVALALLFAAFAQATPGDDAHVVAQRTGAIANGQEGYSQIPCPSGERAIGGGIRSFPAPGIAVRVSAPLSSSAGLLTDGQLPVQWFNRVYNGGTGGPSARDFYSYAMCSASTDATVRIGDFQAQAADKGKGAATVTCPAGQRAIGGGVIGQSSDVGSLAASAPVDETGVVSNTVDGDIARGWTAAVFGADAKFFRAYAICSLTSTATVQTESMTLSQNVHAMTPAICPSGQRALSGGVAPTGPADAIVEATLPTNDLGGNVVDSQPVAKGWEAAVWNITGPGTVKYNVSAVCEGPSDAGTDPGGGGGETPPSNDFTVGELTKNKARGTATLPVTVPGPGEVVLSSAKLKEASAEADAAGSVNLKLKATGNAKKKLKRKGKLKAAAEISFTPTGGTESSQTEKLKLVRKR